MGLSDEGDEVSVLSRFNELCLDLNMDNAAREESLANFYRVQTNFSLEGDQLHWLACSLYEACRRSVLPTVGSGTLEGNCVSLTRLLRSAKFSLLQFFNKMRKWSDMVSLSREFCEKVDRLERNFAVSTVIFKKFGPIFLEMFTDLTSDTPRNQRSKKQRRMPCSVRDVFNFSWTLFVQVKGHFPAISDDLVNSYHLLLCCVDWMFANALLGGRKDLLKPNFSNFPENCQSREWKAPVEYPCHMDMLCLKHDGLVVEAKTIKEHWWKPHVKRMFERKVLKGRVDTLSAILETGNFDANVKAINNAYEEYVLTVGDFDERIFLGDEADEEIGTPSRQHVCSLSDEMHRRSQKQHFDEVLSLAPDTPLTGRIYLRDKEQCHVTPVSTATHSVSRLQTLLSGRKTTPSDKLLEEFESCSRNPTDDIATVVNDMGDTFCNAYIHLSDNDDPGVHFEFAQNRLKLGQSLYYKTLESIVAGEKTRLSSSCKDSNETVDLSGLLAHEMFHRSLFACCLEIVIFSYNSQRLFPWIVNIFELAPYHFYKVIEIIVRAAVGLPRDVVKHLNHVEEQVLESYAWSIDSPFWHAVKDCSSLPLRNDVTPICPHSQCKMKIVTTAHHPRIHSLMTEGSFSHMHGFLQREDSTLSPTGPSAATIFSSPSPGSVKRRLFPDTSSDDSSVIKWSGSGEVKTVGTVTSAGQLTSCTSTQTIVAITGDGKQVLIPVNVAVNQLPGYLLDKASVVKKADRPKTAGSLALFLRKVYNLAAIRLRELCIHLQLSEDDHLRSKIWTCFEQALTLHPDLFMDRHIDQILMCSIYIMAKVSERPINFHDIMRCYRFQPQSQSHVYRSVLLTGRRRQPACSNSGIAFSSSSPSNCRDRHSGHSSEGGKLEALDSSTLSCALLVPTTISASLDAFDTSGASQPPGGAERGDLIQFYNALPSHSADGELAYQDMTYIIIQVFTEKLRTFALWFSSENISSGCPPLSPLPLLRSNMASPRRVSTNHEVYVSPHRTAVVMNKQNSRFLTYCINQSPARDLVAINKMICLEDSGWCSSPKHSLDVDCDVSSSSECSSRVIHLSSSPFSRRLQDFSQEQRGTSIR